MLGLEMNELLHILCGLQLIKMNVRNSLPTNKTKPPYREIATASTTSQKMQNQQHRTRQTDRARF
jgi:hypothetical protein